MNSHHLRCKISFNAAYHLPKNNYFFFLSFFVSLKYFFSFFFYSFFICTKRPREKTGTGINRVMEERKYQGKYLSANFFVSFFFFSITDLRRLFSFLFSFIHSFHYLLINHLLSVSLTFTQCEISLTKN